MELTEKEQQARKMVCLPLDNLCNIKELESRVQELSSVVGLFKVGKGSFTKFGTDAVRVVQEYGAEVFLDLKYHDIPATVKDAAEGASRLGVYMFNVHASGGSEMMKAAVEGAKYGAGDSGLEIPKIVGVSVLTSIDERILNEELKVSGSVKDHVNHLALLSNRNFSCSSNMASFSNLRIILKDSFSSIFWIIFLDILSIFSISGYIKL